MWRAVPIVALLLLLVAGAFFAPFLKDLHHYRGSVFLIGAELSFSLAVVALLSRAFKASRWVSVSALLLAVPVSLYFISEAADTRRLYRLHAVAPEACRLARSNPQLTRAAVFEQATRLAGLSPEESLRLGLDCEDFSASVHRADGFDPYWWLTAGEESP